MSKRLWDFTALNTLEACEEEFVRRFVGNLAPAFPDPSAHFGSAVHAGVAALYSGETPDVAGQQAAARWSVETPEVGKKVWLTAEYASAIVKEFAARSPWGFKAELNERYLEDPESGFCGIVDRVQERAGELAVVDLKTTGLFLGPEWGEQWAQSAQAAGYLDLAEQAIGKPVTSFWCDAIAVNKRGYPKPEDFHSFGPFSYSPALREELRRARAYLIFRARELERDPKWAWKRTHSCFRYNKLCSFFRYCRSEPEEREARYQLAEVSGELIKREWKPRERL